MKNRKLQNSFINAFNGIFQAFKTERNVKLHTVAALIAILLAIILKFSAIEWLILIIVITIVVVAELLNTAIEYTVDMVCGERYHEYAKYAKDIAAGATLIAAIGAVIMGCILYMPKILQFIS